MPRVLQLRGRKQGIRKPATLTELLHLFAAASNDKAIYDWYANLGIHLPAPTNQQRRTLDYVKTRMPVKVHGFRRFPSSTNIASGKPDCMKSRFYRTAAPLITRIQKLFSDDLAKENDFLRQENRILRRKSGHRAPLTESERRTWTTWNPQKPNSPLLESGLLGPVTLQGDP